MQIARFQNTASQEDVAGALRETGCAIIERIVSTELVDRINGELAPYFEKWGYGSGTFQPKRTKKMARVPVKSPASHEVITHPFILGVIDKMLRTEAYNFMLHHGEACLLYPGETEQTVHRDDVTYPFKHPCPPIQIGVIWAMSDFTEANGATRAVPGSHLWDDERKPMPDEFLVAEMPKSSVFLFDSAVYHGYGANRTENEVRSTLIFSYGVSWLRPVENQWLAVPPALAKNMSRKMQELLGYHTHGYLGHYEFQKPEVLLQDEVPEAFQSFENVLEGFKGIEIRRR